jgi:hypothetical protein
MWNSVSETGNGNPPCARMCLLKRMTVAERAIHSVAAASFLIAVATGEEGVVEEVCDDGGGDGDDGDVASCSVALLSPAPFGGGEVDQLLTLTLATGTFADEAGGEGDAAIVASSALLLLEQTGSRKRSKKTNSRKECPFFL